ncbi:MAG: hypothetical protein QNJ97_24375 [Myxococcota bacterium]|nr:hypothetical protein [Myxococcota bacterium]
MNLDTATHPDTMQEQISLASKYQVGHTPARALISLLDATLAMTLIAIDRDYPDFQEIMWAVTDGEKVNRSTFIIHTLAESCVRIREQIAAYNSEMDHEHRVLQIQNSPF